MINNLEDHIKYNTATILLNYIDIDDNSEELTSKSAELLYTYIMNESMRGALGSCGQVYHLGKNTNDRAMSRSARILYFTLLSLRDELWIES